MSVLKGKFGHHFFAGAAEGHRYEMEALGKAASKLMILATNAGRCDQWDAAAKYIKELEDDSWKDANGEKKEKTEVIRLSVLLRDAGIAGRQPMRGSPILEKTFD